MSMFSETRTPKVSRRHRVYSIFNNRYFAVISQRRTAEGNDISFSEFSLQGIAQYLYKILFS